MLTIVSRAFNRATDHCHCIFRSFFLVDSDLCHLVLFPEFNFLNDLPCQLDSLSPLEKRETNKTFALLSAVVNLAQQLQKLIPGRVCFSLCCEQLPPVEKANCGVLGSLVRL
jgi:hypothetical protein